MSIEEENLIAEAQFKYNTDAEFHALVYAAVRLTVPETVNSSINTALLEVAKDAASVVLVLKEKSNIHE